jgi:hypothetical protein
MRLDRLPDVKEAIQEQTDAILAEYWLSRQRSMISVTGEDMADFRQSHSFEKAAKRFGQNPSEDQIIDLITAYKMALVKLEAADSLKVLFPVMVDSVLFQSCIPDPDAFLERDPVPFVVRELYF